MAANSILKLKVESEEYDAKLKKAAEGIRHLADVAHKGGGDLTGLEKAELDYIRALGDMETKSRTAAGQVRELSNTYKELKVIYDQLNDVEKADEGGKALAASLNQLKSRAQETKVQLDAASKSLEITGDKVPVSKFGQFGNVIDSIGQKMGINANITELLTSQTALLTGAIGAGITIVTKATEAWAAYNAELAKQDQITTVTTGLKGEDADRMTDKMRALSDTYNVDFREAVNAANVLMAQFGESGDNAIRIIKDGMQGMIHGDGPKLLSMIQQYAPAFRDAGVSASQLVAVIQNSEGGLFTDQNMNAIVFGIKNIRLMTKQTSAALAQLGIDGQKMSEQLSNGTMTVFDALRQVAGQLKNVDSNSKAAGEVMQAVFGRQGAMAGTNLAKAIESLNTDLEQTKKQTGEVGDALADLQAANEKLNKAIRDCFEYDGWDQMAAGIKANLITALSDVVIGIENVKNVLTSDIGRTIFDTISSGAASALGPLGTLYNVLKDILNMQGSIGTGTGNGGGNTKTGMNVIFERIMSYNSKDAREKAYQFYLRRINQRLAKNQTTVVKDDGNGHYTESTRPNQNANNKKLLNDRLLLINSHDRLINAPIRKNNSTNTPPTITVNTIPTTTTGGGGRGGHTGGGNNNVIPTEEQLNSARINELTQEYINASQERQEAIRQEIAALKERNEQIEYLKGEAQGKYSIGTLPTDNLNNPSEQIAGIIKRNVTPTVDMSDIKAYSPLESLKMELKSLTELQEEFGGYSSEIWQKYQEDIDAVQNKINEFTKKSLNSSENIADSWSAAASAASAVGSALQSIDDPAAKTAAIIANAVATVAQSIAMITKAHSEALANDSGAKSNVYAMIAASAAMAASLISTVSAIKSVNKFAEGGIVPGNSYSGDNVPAMLNSGETVLNVAQSRNVADALLHAIQLADNIQELPTVLSHTQQLELANNFKDVGSGSNMRPYVDGERVFLGISRMLKRSGQGEIVTTSMLRKWGVV